MCSRPSSYTALFSNGQSDDHSCTAAWTEHECDGRAKRQLVSRRLARPEHGCEGRGMHLVAKSYLSNTQGGCVARPERSEGRRTGSTTPLASVLWVGTHRHTTAASVSELCWRGHLRQGSRHGEIDAVARGRPKPLVVRSRMSARIQRKGGRECHHRTTHLQREANRPLSLLVRTIPR